jgi:S-adenosylmethionine:tRNA ribosyltransferase-isomerase
MPELHTPSLIPALDAADFSYELPQERIAVFPRTVRDQSRLLHWDGNQIHHRQFNDLPGLLKSGTLVVFNNSKVIFARLEAKKSTGGMAELFCLEPQSMDGREVGDFAHALAKGSPQVWRCLVGGKNIKPGDRLTVLTKSDSARSQEWTMTADILEKQSEEAWARFTWDPPSLSLSEVLATSGQLPLPPYLKRKATAEDQSAYQTVVAKHEGSVAAPTAGLHFTKKVLSELKASGVATEEVTLHVGLGTFKPLKVEDLREHSMHQEAITVSRSFLENLLAQLKRREAGGAAPVVAVGTTSLRTLESINIFGAKLRSKRTAEEKGVKGVEPIRLLVRQWDAFDLFQLGLFNDQPTSKNIQEILNEMEMRDQTHLSGSSQVFIVPGFPFRVVDQLVTNFHQPKSTLIALVAAFVGSAWHEIYQAALAEGYRFLSYGDASLLYRSETL